MEEGRHLRARAPGLCAHVLSCWKNLLNLLAHFEQELLVSVLELQGIPE
jgi:hypothetical protein